MLGIGGDGVDGGGGGDGSGGVASAESGRLSNPQSEGSEQSLTRPPECLPECGGDAPRALAPSTCSNPSLRPDSASRSSARLAQQQLDLRFFEALFPAKEQGKLERWLEVLREEEFETLDELAALGDKEWEALPLPLAVRAKIRHALASPPPLAPPTPLAPSAPLVPAPAPPPEPPSTTGRSRVLASRNVPSPTAMAAPIVGLGGNWGLESPLLASFLAVFFQALWCVRPFRRAVLALPPSNEKIASSVKLLMSSLFGQRTASPKSLLRAAFPPSLLDKARGFLDVVDDPSEYFEAALSVLSESGDAGLVDAVTRHFRARVSEVCECACGQLLLEPMGYHQCSFFVCGSLLLQAEGGSLAGHLRTALGPSCPMPNCSLQTLLRRYVVQPLPSVITVAIVWDVEPLAEATAGEAARTILSRVDLSIEVPCAFEGGLPEGAHSRALLLGLVCRASEGWCGFFLDDEKRVWQWFDQSSSAPVGEGWSVVVERCDSLGCKPAYLFYAPAKAD